MGAWTTGSGEPGGSADRNGRPIRSDAADESDPSAAPTFGTGYIYRPEDYPFGGYPGPSGIPARVGDSGSAVDTLPVTGAGPRPAPWLPPVGYVPPEKRGQTRPSNRHPDTPRGQPASMVNRVLAKLIDGLIVGLPLSVFYIWAGNSGNATAQNAVSLVIVVATLVYETYFVARYGATVGKRMRGILVIDEATGARLSVRKSFARSLTQYAINYLFLASLWTPFLDRPKLRGWHDKAAGDVVVTAGTAVVADANR